MDARFLAVIVAFSDWSRLGAVPPVWAGPGSSEAAFGVCLSSSLPDERATIENNLKQR